MVPVSRRMGIPWTRVWQGVGIIATWFMAGGMDPQEAARRDLQRDMLYPRSR